VGSAVNKVQHLDRGISELDDRTEARGRVFRVNVVEKDLPRVQSRVAVGTKGFERLELLLQLFEALDFPLGADEVEAQALFPLAPL
jgi:hypothetical protein